MTRLPDWEEEMQRMMQASGLHTHRRTARILQGPALNGNIVWGREEIRTADLDGNIYTLDRAWATHAVCGCVLTKESGQIICTACSGVVCKEHVMQCRYCHQFFCPRHIVRYGSDDSPIFYCRRHRFIHYLKLLGGMKE